MTPIRRLAATAVVALSFGALAACGGESDDESPAEDTTEETETEDTETED